VPGKPNIVLFVPDSYRGDVLGHQGNPAAVTPHLDRFVASGAVSYDCAFSQSPVCTPSRCSFMPGWYPHVRGHRTMRYMLRQHDPNLLSVLRREGYHVWWGGKNDLVQVRQPEDYLRYCDEKFQPEGLYADQMEYREPAPLDGDDPRLGAYYKGLLRRDGPGRPHYDGDTAWVLGAVDMIRNWSSEQPFCCYLPLGKPHPPYCAEEDFYQSIDPGCLPPRVPPPGEGANLPAVLDALRAEYRSDAITDEMWRDAKRLYYAMCAKVDSLFGMVVDALQERGLYDDTWVLFFSDHGDFTGDYSLPEKTHSTLQDCLVHVPLVIKPPASEPVRAGRRRHLTELLDITATLYDMLGVEPRYAHQGRSLRASLAGDDEPIRDAVFAEVGGRRGEEGFVNTDVLSMPGDSFYARQGRAAIPFHQQGSHAVMCRTEEFKYIRRYYTGHHELYDLRADPGETRNLSGRRQCADIERAMETRLLDYFMHTADIVPHEPDSRQV